MATMLAPVRSRAQPRNDPRFKRVIERLDADARKLKQHPTAAKKAAEPAKAAKPPANEKAAGARSKQVDKIEQAETKKPQTSSFLALLQAEIAKAMPKTLGDTEKFMQGGASEQMKSSLEGNVAQQKQQASGGLKTAAGQAPSEAGVPGKPVTPIAPEPGVAPPQVNAGDAMPAPKPDAEISLQASKSELADATRQNKIDDLNKSAWQTDSRYSTMLTAKDSVGKHADAAPAKYRAREVATLAQAATRAMNVARKGASALLGLKGGNKAKILSRQEQQKAREELELKGFSDFVVATFEQAKRAVDKRLTDLDTRVNDLFDQGVESALSTMKSFVSSQLLQYKLKRYILNPLNLITPGAGIALWIKDQILDLPEEVNRFYEAGRAQFTVAMNALAGRVSNLVESELAAAKAEVGIAKGKIAAKASNLSPGVKSRAAQVQAQYAEKFAELETGIEDKKQQIAEGLAQKYQEACQKADDAEKEMRAADKSLLDQAKDKIAGFVQALADFKNRLMGIVKKGAETVDLILKDPMQFLGNLLAAIKAGFNQFKGNILKHLAAGFSKWLFGALAGAGIEVPTDLSVVSVLKLVLGVLGITYDRMRAKAVKLLGPVAVAIIEKLVSYLQTLIGGGPAALWKQIQGDLSSLKEMVIDAIRDWIITTIVTRAVAKIVSMFNPAGAIIQAIMMIVSVVQFVVERASQIMDFVEAVINSIHAIAQGAIGGAANWIERSLANMIPILIGFLASLIGLGGLSAKIRGFILKVQTKVDKAIDKAIAKIVGVVKKLFGKLTGKDKEDKEDKRTDAEKHRDVQSAIREAETLLDNPKLTAKQISKRLPSIRKKYKLRAMALAKESESKDSETDYVTGEINPKGISKRVKKSKAIGGLTSTTKVTRKGVSPGVQARLKGAEGDWERYELGAMQNVVVGELIPEWEKRTGVPIITKYTKLESAQYMARFKTQKEFRVGSRRPKPEGRVEILAPSGKGTISHVFVVEVTTVRDLSDTSGETGAPVRHKLAQIPNTIETLISKYGPGPQIEYTIICPRDLKPDEEEILNGLLNRPDAKNLKMVWVKTGV